MLLKVCENDCRQPAAAIPVQQVQTVQAPAVQAVPVAPVVTASPLMYINFAVAECIPICEQVKHQSSLRIILSYFCA